MSNPFDVSPLLQAMARETDAIKRQVEELLQAAARGAMNDTQDGYPQGPTGNLRAGVRYKWSQMAGDKLAVKIATTAPHRHFIEGGRDGMGRAGRKHVPARVTFVPAAIRRREAYQAAARDVLAQKRELT